MRQNPDFIMKTVAGRTVLVPVGPAAVRFPGMVSLNETGKLLWDLLERDRSAEELLELLEQRFEVEHSQLGADVEVFLRRLRLAGAILPDKEETI